MSDCRVCGSETDGFACRTCIGRLERQLAELPSLLHELTVTETRQGRVYRAGGRPERDAEASSDPEAHVRADLRSRDGRIALRPSALPFDENASVLRDETWATCAAWGKHLAESKGIDGPSNATLLVWLASNAESIRWDEAAAEMVDEIDDVHRRLTRAIDRSPSRIYAGPCDATTAEGRCTRDVYARFDLFRAEDDETRTVTCDGWVPPGEQGMIGNVGCGTAHTVVERVRWLANSVAEALVTIDEFRGGQQRLFPDLIPVPTASFTGWVRDGRLMAYGKNHVGELTYRGSDLLALVTAYRPKRSAPRPSRRKCA